MNNSTNNNNNSTSNTNNTNNNNSKNSTDGDDKFVNIGSENWQKIRQEWRKNSTGKERMGEEMNDFDIQQVMSCLRAYRKFPTNVPLAAIVEILNVLWEEDAS